MVENPGGVINIKKPVFFPLQIFTIIYLFWFELPSLFAMDSWDLRQL